MLERHKNTTMNAIIWCPTVFISAIMNKDGMYGKSIKSVNFFLLLSENTIHPEMTLCGKEHTNMAASSRAQI